MCFECRNSRNGDVSCAWTSVTYGIFICVDCAGEHRHLGVDKTFCRSSTLDHWTAHQLERLVCGGNTRARAYFGGFDMLEMPLAQRYAHPLARDYAATLTREVEARLGREPVEPDEPMTASRVEFLEKYKNATAISSADFNPRPAPPRSRCCAIL